MRAWGVKRRERTRHLIELGGLVVKSGFEELTGDDRAALYGGFLELVLQLQQESCGPMLALWRRRGGRTFKEEYEKRVKNKGEVSIGSVVIQFPPICLLPLRNLAVAP
jgi:hypothetical protein